MLGSTINANKDSILNRLTTALQTTGNTALEMWLYNSTVNSNQVMMTSGGNKFLFNTAINGRYLYVSIYTLTPSSDGTTIDFALSRQLIADLQPVVPLRQWTHVVLQGAGLNNNNLSVYVNGVACPLTSNALPGGGGGALTNTPSGIIYPENLTTLKHFRLYNRLLNTTEIANNAAVPCFGLSTADLATLNPALLYWGRYNVSAPGPDGSTVESQYRPVYPNHTLATSYAYQSLDGVTLQHTPDGGKSRFWYDMLGRLVTSQNAEQLAPVNGGATNRYSYTKFDDQGRIIEVGEKAGGIAQTEVPFIALTYVTSFLASGTNSQVTKTFYDAPYSGVNLFQENLRKRVSATTYQDLATGVPQQATYYSYDQIGNVKTLWQQLPELGVKRIDYRYDVVRGTVNTVRYQRGAKDRFYYSYQHDADNRLIKASSGIDSVSSDGWEIENSKTDAAYRYYLHGPLARIELGNFDLVQGLDYAYTLQGSLKGVNSNYLSAATDMGRDGVVGGNRAVIARDVYSYTLDYYTGDYYPIGNDQNSLGLNWMAQSGDVMGRNLYDGNISRSTLTLSKLNNGNAVGYTYRYDQLDRLTAMRQHVLINGATIWNTVSVGNSFKEDIKYDGNGNIQKYIRYGSGVNGKQLQMDSLRYIYTKDASGNLTNNRLTQVLDSISGDPYTEDISSQPINNYIYDNIGNLVTNVRDSVISVNWTVYGKIKSIIKSDNSSLEYRYDANGNRVYKGYTHGSVTDRTFYIRNAQGNTIAIYSNRNGGTDLYWKEQDLYGSGRLGIWEPDILVGSDVDTTWNKLGLKRYELTNHLGNVMATISDKAIWVTDHYMSEVLSTQDYYPFGMLQPDRSYSLGNYRYGFNGKEYDNEVKGKGNQQDYGMRVYDPRLGRFLSVDPLTKNYPWYTPYQFAGNKPIMAVDLDGMEERKVVTPWLDYSVDMSKAPATFKSTSGKIVTSTYTLHGWPRNHLYFWEKVIEQSPNFLDEFNTQRVLEKGYSPILTKGQQAHWNAQGIGPEGLKLNEVLEHHHINQQRTAVPLTTSEHRQIPRTTTKSVIASRLGLGMTYLGIISEISALRSGKPDALINQFGNHTEVGVVYKSRESEHYYTLNSVSRTSSDASATFDIFSSYRYDYNSGKYVGQGKIGYGTSYQQSGGYSETNIYNLNGQLQSSEVKGNKQESNSL